MKGRGLLVVLVIALALTIAAVPIVTACAPKPEAPAPTPELPPIKIGHLAEMTGLATGMGQLFHEGIELRLDEAGWEVGGRKIELITEDSADSPDVAVDKARKLVEIDKVDVIFGPLFSHSGMAVASYLAPKKVLNIAEFGHPYQVQGETLLVPGGPAIGMNVGLGRFAYEKFGARTATTIAGDYVAGHQLAESFQIGFKEAGGTIIKEFHPPLDETDFMPYLMAIGKPDCLFYFCMSPVDGLLFISQFIESGLEMPLLLGFGPIVEPVMAVIGDGILGMYGSSPYTWMLDNPTNKRFVEAFKKKYDGRLPDCTNAHAYRSASVFIEAVKATDGDTSFDKLMEAALALSIETPQGLLQLDPNNHFGKPPWYIVKAVKVDGIYAWEEIESYTIEVPKGWSPPE